MAKCYNLCVIIDEETETVKAQTQGSVGDRLLHWGWTDGEGVAKI